MTLHRPLIESLLFTKNMKKFIAILLLSLSVSTYALDVEVTDDGQVTLIDDKGQRLNAGCIKDAWFNNIPYRVIIEAKALEKARSAPKTAAIPIVANLAAVKFVDIPSDVAALADDQAKAQAKEEADRKAKREEDAEAAKVAEFNRLFPNP